MEKAKGVKIKEALSENRLTQFQCDYHQDKLIQLFIFLFSFALYRGPEMLIAFHSSPFSAPLKSGISNRGFELDVDILFSDSDSYDFAETPKCEFHINASNPGEFKNKTLCI